MTSRRRGAAVFYGDRVAGRIRETESGMESCCDVAWLNDERNPPVSLTMPLRAEPYATASAHPFFLGLLPEGWESADSDEAGAAMDRTEAALGGETPRSSE